MKKEYILIILAFLIIGAFFIYRNKLVNLDLNTKETNDVKEVSDQSDYFNVSVEYLRKNLIGSDDINSFIDNYLYRFKNLAENEARNGDDVNFRNKYSLDMNLDIHNSENYISYILFLSEYTGGANVNQSVRSFVYNKETKNQVSISDVVGLDNSNNFLSRVKSRLYNKSDQIGVFSNQVNGLSIDSLDSFYVTDDSIIVLFSKYEVAPGAAGIVEVNLKR